MTFFLQGAVLQGVSHTYNIATASRCSVFLKAMPPFPMGPTVGGGGGGGQQSSLLVANSGIATSTG